MTLILFSANKRKEFSELHTWKHIKKTKKNILFLYKWLTLPSASEAVKVLISDPIGAVSNTEVVELNGLRVGGYSFTSWNLCHKIYNKVVYGKYIPKKEKKKESGSNQGFKDKTCKTF